MRLRLIRANVFGSLKKVELGREGDRERKAQNTKDSFSFREEALVLMSALPKLLEFLPPS